jgi:Zinc finger, C3HC4 type (RING finger)
LDLAMTGKVKVGILQYLIQRGLNIDDVKDHSLVPKTLEHMLKTGVMFNAVSSAIIVPPDDGMDVDTSDHDIDYSEGSVTNMDDACTLCCEKSMDCVLIPCGHQLCCTECGHQLKSCPVCKVQCSVLRVFR